MMRTRSGWQHTDTRCTGWAIRNTCSHVEELNMETETTVVRASPDPLTLIEELEDKAIIAAITGQVTATWVYSFSQGGAQVVGLSVDGVEAAAREMAKRGEAIREMDVHIEFEDDGEARFLARAGRYAVNADGREVLLDVAIRAKRQPKVMHLKSGGVRTDEHWYEKGVAKAARNAKEALIGEEVKAYIIAEAGKGRRTKRVEAKVPPPPLAEPFAGEDMGEPSPQPAASPPPRGGEGAGKARNELTKALEARFGEDEQAAFEFVQKLFPDACAGTAINYARVPAADCQAMITELEKPREPKQEHAGIGAE